MNFPSVLPTLKAAIGPNQGILEIERANQIASVPFTLFDNTDDQAKVEINALYDDFNPITV